MSYFVVILLSIAVSDIIMVWLCLEQHGKALKATHPQHYLRLDWVERFCWLCEKDENIVVFAFFIPCLLFAGLLQTVVGQL